MIPWWKQDLGDAEVEAVTRAIRERHINQGPVCRELEQRLAGQLGVPHVVAVSNGSQALLMALLACGVGPGDEVIVPAFTFIASAHAVLLLGASVRLVDVRRDRPLIDVDRIEAAITKKTKVIMPVHLNGRACDMAAINAVAARHGLRVVEDAAQAFCSRGPAGWLGTQADAGTFAMDMVKLMTTGEGGFIAVRDEELYTRLIRLRNQGVLPSASRVFDAFGFNFKFPDVLAAIGLAQASRLERRMQAVREVYRRYEGGLADLGFVRLLPVRTGAGELPMWVEVLSAERDRVEALLKQEGITTVPLPPCLAESGHLRAAGMFPNATFYGRHGLVLPCGPDQPPEAIDRVIEALHGMAAKIRGRPEPGGEDA